MYVVVPFSSVRSFVFQLSHSAQVPAPFLHDADSGMSEFTTEGKAYAMACKEHGRAPHLEPGKHFKVREADSTTDPALTQEFYVLP